ncbi:diguanylate cyclase [Sulfurimonas sp.]|uniref:sensor domain-containing diguanylate cyclase n=1 Tax=Sulfurimonas sp. TaxID=2022749 RepID=UPI0039E6C5CD
MKNDKENIAITEQQLKNTVKVFEVNDSIVSQWQEIVNSLAKILDVPAALIMRLNEDQIEVFRTSKSTNNPFKVKDNIVLIDSGIYCEAVVKEGKPLYVPDALQDEKWKNSPEVDLNMISYFGFPIKYSDATLFGTLCVMDDHKRSWNLEQEKILIQFRNMIESHLELITTVEQVKILNKSLENMAYHDYLTNIYNRRYFFEVATTTIARSKRDKTPVSIVMIDIDNFKTINDNYGHDNGDEVIKFLCKEVTSRIRASDIFARFGGEEFILLLPNTSKDDAVVISQKIRSTIEKTSVNDIKFTVSFGVSQVDFKHDTLENTIKKADNGLYEAKSTGKNRVCAGSLAFLK